MSRIWSHIPAWADWIVALAAAIIVMNLNVTKAGDPLRSAGAEGISDLARTVFYSSLMLGGIIACVMGFAIATLRPAAWSTGALVASTFAWVALAGTAGLLLDYRDGPVRTVQMAAYLATALVVIRIVRITQLTRPNEQT